MNSCEFADGGGSLLRCKVNSSGGKHEMKLAERQRPAARTRGLSTARTYISILLIASWPASHEGLNSNQVNGGKCCHWARTASLVTVRFNVFMILYARLAATVSLKARKTLCGGVWPESPSTSCRLCHAR